MVHEIIYIYLDGVWDELTAEKIFFIRVFCENHKEVQIRKKN